MVEIIFEVTEDEVDAGYSAGALGCGIHTRGGPLEERRHNIKEAVDRYFDETMTRPELIRLHFVRDEGLKAWSCPASARTARAGATRTQTQTALV